MRHSSVRTNVCRFQTYTVGANEDFQRVSTPCSSAKQHYYGRFNGFLQVSIALVASAERVRHPFIGASSMTLQVRQRGLVRVLGTFMVAMGFIHVIGCDRPRTKEEMLSSTSPEMRRILDPPEGSTLMSTPMVTAGIENPVMILAKDANIDPQSLVIGVIVEGRARAYPVRALSGMLQHVVNDVVESEGGNVKPLTITYCDMTDCVRVLAPEDGSIQSSLGLGTLGLLDGGLALTYGQNNYKQTDAIPGLIDYESQKMPWGEWLAQHPETLVYAGSDVRDVQLPNKKSQNQSGSEK